MKIAELGAVVYWCEGSKREEDRRVEFVNSDPRMISVFMRYPRTKQIDEARVRARMTLHIQDDETECRRYWKEVTGLSDSNFLRAVIKPPSFSRHPLPHGTLAIRYNSVGLVREIAGEITDLVRQASVELPTET